MSTPILSAELVRELLHYNPETGALTWRVDRPRHKAGEDATCSGSGHYRRVSMLNTSFCAAKLAWMYVHGVWPPQRMRHLNALASDNRLANLRPLSVGTKDPELEKERRATPKMPGVAWDRAEKRWFSIAMPYLKNATGRGISAQCVHLGFFDTPEQAYQAKLDYRFPA